MITHFKISLTYLMSPFSKVVLYSFMVTAISLCFCDFAIAVPSGDPKCADDAAIYIPITKNFTDAAKVKIGEIAGNAKVNTEEVTKKIKEKLKSEDITSTILNKAIDSGLKQAAKIIDSYNEQVDKAKSAVSDAIAKTLTDDMPHLKIRNTYSYYCSQQDPGDPGWATSLLDVEGATFAKGEFKLSAKATITTGVDAGILAVGEFDISCGIDTSYSITLSGTDPIAMKPMDKPVSKGGGSVKLVKSWTVSGKVELAVALEVGASSSANETLDPLLGELTAGTVNKPPVPK